MEPLESLGRRLEARVGEGGESASGSEGETPLALRHGQSEKKEWNRETFASCTKVQGVFFISAPTIGL